MTSEKPKDKTYDELIEILHSQLLLIPPEIGDIKDFLAVLKQLTEHCNFGDFLKQALCDRFVCGLINESLQKLTLEKAVDIATAMELAINDASEIHKNADKLTTDKMESEKVHNVTKAGPCFSCEKSGHFPRDCKFYIAVCNTCKQQGHISSVCRSSNHNQQRNKPICPPRQNKTQEAHTTEVECLNIFKCEEGKSDPIMIHVSIEGKPIDMELDTGS